MKVTLLVENNSLFNTFFNSEHGFSAWVEDYDKKILYDCGYSDNFIKNAEKMGIDLLKADYIIISHGHADHGGGLKHLIKYYQEKAMAHKPILLFAHEDAILPKYAFIWNTSIGLDVDYEIMKRHFDVRVVKEPLWLTKNLCFMGITEISNDYEREQPQIPMKFKDGEWVDDYVIEDTYLAYRHKSGEEVSIVAGCAHYGICNIMEYAKKLTGANRIHTYFGGSHLRREEVSDNRLDKTCEYVQKAKIKRFYICHDTDLICKMALGQVTPIIEAGTSTVVECV